jgi:hypothetical protein
MIFQSIPQLIYMLLRHIHIHDTCTQTQCTEMHYTVQWASLRFQNKILDFQVIFVEWKKVSEACNNKMRANLSLHRMQFNIYDHYLVVFVPFSCARRPFIECLHWKALKTLTWHWWCVHSLYMYIHAYMHTFGSRELTSGKLGNLIDSIVSPSFLDW